MNQLDLFVPAVAIDPTEERPAAVQKKETKKLENAFEAIPPGTEQKEDDLKLKKDEKGNADAYPIFFESRNKPVNAGENTNNVVFADNNISVKIKAKASTDGSVTADYQQQEAKVKPRKTIVNSQPRSEYSLQLNDKMLQVKNSIKEGLLNDNAEKKKKQKEKKEAGQRGRKSLKEAGIEADLIEVPDDESLFKKQYYAISEVAGWFKVNTSLLRFWEKEFDILKPRKNRKGDRLFRPEDVKNLQLIYQLLRQKKYSIEGAKEYLKTNINTAETQMQHVQTLQKLKNFLLELKANLS